MIRLIQVVFLCVAVTCIYGSPQNRDWYIYPPTRLNHPLQSPIQFPRYEGGQFRPFLHVEGTPEIPVIPIPHPPSKHPRPQLFPSCRKRCGTVGHNENSPCQCNIHCLDFGDCCPDYAATCLSCAGRCFTKYIRQAPCQCNRQCERFENCCEDFEDECSSSTSGGSAPHLGGRFYYGALQQFHPLNDNSCVERCHTTHDPTKPCQCNKSCVQFGDCCIDYNTICVDGSCVDRCGQVGTEPNKPCQCNKPCVTYGDCCPDYSKVCGSNGEVTDPELASLAEELLASDVNSVAAHVSANFQGSTSAGGPDNAPNVLLTVSPSAYDTYTFPKLVALFNNYIPAVGTPEVVTSGEQQEEKDFLDAILSTTIMKRTEEFLESKGLVPSGTFRAKFTEIWFGLYSRSGTVLGSSGFEHVFLGELKNGVSGFHGWAFFAQEEANTNLDYNGHLATLSLGSKGSVITHTFDWLNNKKPISSMFIGTSPEFDMAVFTVCWFARPNAKCPITLNGAKLNIQTYDITYGGKKYVASAYPDIPV